MINRGLRPIGHSGPQRATAGDGASVRHRVSFAWGAGILAVGAIICGLLVRPGAPDTSQATARTAVHM
ncbi:hypothetical protein FRAHR75_650023 [Frankia sp. Hr75.2]|nr:hypothetical protein FRAHR75_650023 [Frankia sp. Hr75.2]